MSWKKTIVGACVAGTVAAVLISNWDAIVAQGDYLLSRVDGRHSKMIRTQRWFSDVGDIVVEMTAERAREMGIDGIDRGSFGLLIDHIVEDQFAVVSSYFYSCDKISKLNLRANSQKRFTNYYVYVRGKVRYDGSKFFRVKDITDFFDDASRHTGRICYYICAMIDTWNKPSALTSSLVVRLT